MSKAREAAARAVELARKESAAAHVGRGTPDPEVWKLCRRQEGAEAEIFVGPMDRMIEAMDASIAKDISNAAIDAFLAQLKADGYKLVRREATEEMDNATQDFDVYWAYTQDGRPGMPKDVWSAMWDAAPEAGQ